MSKLPKEIMESSKICHSFLSREEKSEIDLFVKEDTGCSTIKIQRLGSRLGKKKFQIGPGGLRAPCVLACAMRSLAIVFTIVQSFSLSFFLFPPSSAFDPLRGISRVRKFVSPNILAYLEDICKKKICFLGNFFSP